MTGFQNVVLKVGKDDIIKLEMKAMRAHVVKTHKSGVISVASYQFPHHDHALDALNFFKKNEKKN